MPGTETSSRIDWIGSSCRLLARHGRRIQPDPAVSRA